MSTRVALGASRGSVVLQVMGELLVLISLGSVVALLGSARSPSTDSGRWTIGFIPGWKESGSTPGSLPWP